ncbi:hypothetical protein Pgy4_41884, partial [Pseudomonas savastanoi pv. glycinea str. race 4]
GVGGFYYVHQTNLKATEYLKISGRTHVTVYEMH